MATRIDGTKIFITRGDTPTLDVSAIIEVNNTPYDPASGDAIYFRAKQSIYDTEYAIEKTVEDGQLVFAVEDTASLSFGNYVYSLELVTASGYHETFVTPEEGGSLTIGLEVENHG